MKALSFLLATLCFSDVVAIKQKKRNFLNPYPLDDDFLFAKNDDNFLLSNTSTFFQATKDEPNNQPTFLRGPG